MLWVLLERSGPVKGRWRFTRLVTRFMKLELHLIVLGNSCTSDRYWSLRKSQSIPSSIIVL